MNFYSLMVNAWSLLYEELNGTMDEEYPIMTDDKNRITPQESDEYDILTGVGNTATEPEHSPYYYDYKRNDPDAKNPFTDAFDHAMAEAVVGGADPKDYPLKQNFLSDNDDNAAHHFVSDVDLTNLDLPDFDLNEDVLTHGGLDYEELNLNIHANSPQEELDEKWQKNLQ